MNFQKTIILGRLTGDVRIEEVSNVGKRARFSVAVNEKFIDKRGVNQENTEFFNVVALGKLAEVVFENIEKSDTVFIEGRLKTREWESGGATKKNIELFADKIQWIKIDKVK